MWRRGMRAYIRGKEITVGLTGRIPTTQIIFQLRDVYESHLIQKMHLER